MDVQQGRKRTVNASLKRENKKRGAERDLTGEDREKRGLNMSISEKCDKH